MAIGKGHMANNCEEILVKSAKLMVRGKRRQPWAISHFHAVSPAPTAYCRLSGRLPPGRDQEKGPSVCPWAEECVHPL